MAISLWIAIAITFILATSVYYSAGSNVAWQRDAQDRKTPTDQVNPLPRHIPTINSQIYS